MNIVSRAAWGARYEAGDGPAPLPAREVWLHHSVTVAPDLLPPYDDEDAAMRLLEQIGEQRFKRGVSYTFAIMPTGRVYEGHGVGTLGAHTARRNSFARAIVLVGNYDTAHPTPAQIESAAALLVHGKRSGWWQAARLNGGHRQAPGASTACPGQYGMSSVAAINDRAAALERGNTSTTGDDEMPSFAVVSVPPDGGQFTIPRPVASNVHLHLGWDNQGLGLPEGVEVGHQQVRVGIHTRGDASAWRGIAQGSAEDGLRFWLGAGAAYGAELRPDEDLIVIRNDHPVWPLGVTVTAWN